MHQNLFLAKSQFTCISNLRLARYKQMAEPPAMTKTGYQDIEPLHSPSPLGIAAGYYGYMQLLTNLACHFVI